MIKKKTYLLSFFFLAGVSAPVFAVRYVDVSSVTNVPLVTVKNIEDFETIIDTYNPAVVLRTTSDFVIIADGTYFVLPRKGFATLEDMQSKKKASFSKSNVVTISGITCELTAFSFQNNVYASFKMKKIRNKQSSDGYRNLKISFSLLDMDGNSVAEYETIYSFDMANKEEQFVRSTFTDYEAYSARCAVTCGNDSRTIKSSVEHR